MYFKTVHIHVLLYAIVYSQINLIIDNYFIKIFPIIGLLAISLFDLNRSKKSFKIPINVLLFTFVLIVGSVRSNAPESSMGYTVYKILCTSTFLLSLFAVLNKMMNQGYSSKKMVELILIKPVVFSVILIFLLVISPFKGIETIYPTKELGQHLASNLSLNFSNSLSFLFKTQTIRHLLGAFLTLFLSFLFFLKFSRGLLLISTTLFFSIIFIDSRIPLLAPFASIAIVAFIKQVRESIAKRFLILFFLFGFVLFTLLTIQANFLIENFGFLSKREGDFLDMNGRLFIWGPALSFILDFNINLIFGYGEFGTYGSNASLMWSQLFQGWESSNMKTAHNTVLTTIFDYGVFGLILLLLIIKRYVEKFYNTISTSAHNAYKVPFSVFIYLLICGQFDSIIGYYLRVFPLIYLHLWLIMEYIFKRGT